MYPYIEEKKIRLGRKLNKKEEENYKNIRSLKSILTKRANCVGFSKVFYYVGSLVGLKICNLSFMVKLKNTFGHQVNLIKINDKWYFFDITNSVNELAKRTKSSFMYEGKDIFDKEILYTTNLFSNDKIVKNKINAFFKENNIYISECKDLRKYPRSKEKYNFDKIVKNLLADKSFTVEKVENISNITKDEEIKRVFDRNNNWRLKEIKKRIKLNEILKNKLKSVNLMEYINDNGKLKYKYEIYTDIKGINEYLNMIKNSKVKNYFEVKKFYKNIVGFRIKREYSNNEYNDIRELLKSIITELKSDYRSYIHDRYIIEFINVNKVKELVTL